NGVDAYRDVLRDAVGSRPALDGFGGPDRRPHSRNDRTKWPTTNLSRRQPDRFHWLPHGSVGGIPCGQYCLLSVAAVSALTRGARTSGDQWQQCSILVTGWTMDRVLRRWEVKGGVGQCWPGAGCL